MSRRVESVFGFEGSSRSFEDEKGSLEGDGHSSEQFRRGFFAGWQRFRGNRDSLEGRSGSNSIENSNERLVYGGENRGGRREFQMFINDFISGHEEQNSYPRHGVTEQVPVYTPREQKTTVTKGLGKQIFISNNIRPTSHSSYH